MQDLLKQNLIAVTQAQKTIRINADLDSMYHGFQVPTALGSRLKTFPSVSYLAVEQKNIHHAT